MRESSKLEERPGLERERAEGQGGIGNSTVAVCLDVNLISTRGRWATFDLGCSLTADDVCICAFIIISEEQGSWKKVL